jgi:hypothetical protein
MSTQNNNTYQPQPVTPFNPYEDQVQATRRTSDELEKAVRDAIDRQTRRK